MKEHRKQMTSGRLAWNAASKQRGQSAYIQYAMQAWVSSLPAPQTMPLNTA